MPKRDLLKKGGKMLMMCFLDGTRLRWRQQSNWHRLVVGLARKIGDGVKTRGAGPSAVVLNEEPVHNADGVNSRDQARLLVIWAEPVFPEVVPLLPKIATFGFILF